MTTCKVTATSDIPLWYGDENGTFPIPHDSQVSCPMIHGMGFMIHASGEDEVAIIAVIHVDVIEYRKVLFDEVVTDPGFEGRYIGYVECNGAEGTIHVTLTEYPHMNEVMITERSRIPLKYVGDTGVKDIPCTVSDMIDQGVQICDGRYSDEEVWEGQGIIISPTLPDNNSITVYPFTDPVLSPADPQYTGQLVAYFGGDSKRAHIRLTSYPQTL